MQNKLKVIALMLAAAGLANHAAQAQEKVVIGYISDLSGLYADLEGKGGQAARRPCRWPLTTWVARCWASP